MASFIGKRMGTSLGIAVGSRHCLGQRHAGWLSLYGIVADPSKRVISRVGLGVPDNWGGIVVNHG